MHADILQTAISFLGSTGAWTVNYAIHSTVLLGGAWVLTRRGPLSEPGTAERLWKGALMAGVVTATVQTATAPVPSASAPIAESAIPPRAIVTPVRFEPSGASFVPVASPATVSRLVELQSPSLEAPLNGSPVLRRPIQVMGVAGARAEARPDTTTPTPSSLTGMVAPALPLVGLAAILAGFVSCGAHLRSRRRLARALQRRVALSDPHAMEALGDVADAAGHDGPVRLTVAAGLPTPVALPGGEICLPARAIDEMPAEMLRAMIAHELAHILRRDPEWLNAALVLEHMLALQPLNRLARIELMNNAEYLCDDWAVRHGGSGESLAACLAHVAGWMAGRHSAPLPVAAMAQSNSPLVSRVARLLGDQRPAPPLRTAAVLAPLALLVSAAMLAPAVSADSPAAASATKATVVRMETTNDAGTPIRVEGGRTIVLPEGSVLTLNTAGFSASGNRITLPADATVEINGEPVKQDATLADGDTLTVKSGKDPDSFRLKIEQGEGGTFSLRAGAGEEDAFAPIRGRAAKAFAFHRPLVIAGSGPGAGVGAAPGVVSISGMEDFAPSKARAGIYTEQPSETLASQLSLDGKNASVISRVADGSAAEKAGLKQHDIVTAIDGRREASPSAVRAYLRGKSPGDTVTFTVLRGGREQTVSVVLEENRDMQPLLFHNDGDSSMTVKMFGGNTAFGPGTFTIDLGNEFDASKLEAIEETLRQQFEQQGIEWDDRMQQAMEEAEKAMEKAMEQRDRAMERSQEQMERAQAKLAEVRERQAAAIAQGLAKSGRVAGRERAEALLQTEVFSRLVRELDAAGLGLERGDRARLDAIADRAAADFVEGDHYTSVSVQSDNGKVSASFGGGDRAARAAALAEAINGRLDESGVTALESKELREKINAAVARVAKSIDDVKVSNR